MFYNDNLKVCEKRIVMGMIDGIPMPTQWFPLDPQPRCENCSAYDTSTGMCSDMGMIIPKLEVLDGFFCVYWEPQNTQLDDTEARK